MIYSPRVCKAMKLAFYAHAGQSDKGDYPYFAHPLHLAEQCTTESETIVALLHDVIEDAGWPERYLQEFCSDEEVAAIKLLTRVDNVPYRDYIQALSTNDLARKIKILDLSHNLDETRAPISASLRVRYQHALRLLEEESQ